MPTAMEVLVEGKVTRTTLILETRGQVPFKNKRHQSFSQPELVGFVPKLHRPCAVGSYPKGKALN